MTAAIHYEGDAFSVPRDKPMGRHFAGHGFLSAFARHSRSPRISGFVRDEKDGQAFCSAIKALQPERSVAYVTAAKPAGLRRIGCFYTSSIINASQAWLRNVHGPRSWSLCGVNHTLSSNRAMDAVAAFPTLPLHPWDALICTSKASKAVIQKLLERQCEHLRQQIGATRFSLPQLPVIPLGVDCQAQQDRAARRDEARSSLGIQAEDIVVLFLGRLSFHAKANPVPMYIALERLARRHRVVLIECGWTANEPIARGLADAKAKLCPSVRAITTDGRVDRDRDRSWAAADIFCSLSDNIQETFGLTPIEAMAAGLPVIVTDWDGYKDTVRDGIDGFTVPTLFGSPGPGLGPAIRHALEVDTYDTYIGHISTTTVVDVDAVTAAFERLASDAALRQRMGANGAARAREVFDWKVIVGAYERLWDELAHLRQAEKDTGPAHVQALRGWPARPDPYELFASFPTAALSPLHEVCQDPGTDAAEASRRLALTVAMLSILPGISSHDLLEFWKRLGPDPIEVGALLKRDNVLEADVAVRSVLLLAKLGLVRIRATGR